nr:hypothetical protein [Tanacetum cinerariifolium]
MLAYGFQIVQTFIVDIEHGTRMKKATKEINRSQKNKSGWGTKRIATEAVWGLKKPEKETKKGLWSGSWGEKVVTGNEGGRGVKELVNDSEKGARSGSSWGQKVVTPSKLPTST